MRLNLIFFFLLFVLVNGKWLQSKIDVLDIEGHIAQQRCNSEKGKEGLNDYISEVIQPFRKKGINVGD